jgi:hypothetical protein
MYVIEVVIGLLALLVSGLWILGVAVEFFTGVRINWSFLFWGLRHRREIEEASVCQCRKPGAQWTPACDPTTGTVTMLVCWHCGRTASPEESAEVMRNTPATDT